MSSMSRGSSLEPHDRVLMTSAYSTVGTPRGGLQSLDLSSSRAPTSMTTGSTARVGAKRVQFGPSWLLGRNQVFVGMTPAHDLLWLGHSASLTPWTAIPGANSIHSGDHEKGRWTGSAGWADRRKSQVTHRGYSCSWCLAGDTLPSCRSARADPGVGDARGVRLVLLRAPTRCRRRVKTDSENVAATPPGRSDPKTDRRLGCPELGICRPVRRRRCSCRTDVVT